MNNKFGMKKPRQKCHSESLRCVHSCRGSCLSYEDFSSLTRLRVSRDAPVSLAKTSALDRVPDYYTKHFARFGILFSVGQPFLNSSLNSALHDGHFVVPALPGS